MPEELYKRIRMRREALRLSQEELAARMGYKSRSSINKIELGQTDIPQSKIEAFAKALNTTVLYLLGEENKQPATMTDDELLKVLDDPHILEIAEKLSKLTPENLELALAQIDLLITHQEKQ